MTATAATAVALLLVVPGAPAALALIFTVGIACGNVFPVVVGDQRPRLPERRRHRHGGHARRNAARSR